MIIKILVCEGFVGEYWRGRWGTKFFFRNIFDISKKFK